MNTSSNAPEDFESEYKQILQSLVRTREDVNILLSELDVLEKSIFRVGEGDFSSSLNNLIRAKTKTVVEPFFLAGTIEKKIIMVKEKLKNLEYLNLTTAFEPSNETIRKISLWIRQNIGQEAVINLSFDKKIIGGAIVEYKGKVVNATLLPLIDNYFLNK
jgi:F0F1-type ATP synthase delta subunit